MNLNPQIRTSFPNDVTKHIDYVIKYEKHSISEPDLDQLEHESYRKLFFDEIKKQSIEIYPLEVKSHGKRHIYALLHCPMERLLVEAETIKLEMNLKTDHLKDLKYEEEIELPFIKFFKEKFSSLKEESDNHISTTFENSIREMFEGIKENYVSPFLFSTTIRSLLVDNILKNVDLGYHKRSIILQKLKTKFKIIEKVNNDQENMEEAEESEQGLEFMLKSKHFEEAFILHDESDHNFELQKFLEKANILFKDENEINAVSLYRVFKSDGNKSHRDIRHELHSKWASFKNLFKYQPITLVRDYFGEEIALYFAWAGMLITSVWIPTLIGLIFFFVGIKLSVDNYNSISSNSSIITNSTISLIFSGAFDNDLTPYYALIICLWGAFFLESWKRRNSELAYSWSVMKFESDEIDLPEHKERKKYLKKKLQNKSVFIKYLYSKENIFKSILSIIILMLMIGIVCMSVAGVVLYRIQIKLKVYPNQKYFQLFIGDIGSTVLNSIFTILLNMIYDVIALVTTKWENHRTRTEFNDNFILKTFAFQFVNNYASLYYLAFFREFNYPNGLFNLGPDYTDRCENGNCMALLTTQVFVSLMIKPLPAIISTIVIPMIELAFRKMKLASITKKIHVHQGQEKQEENSDEMNTNEKHVSVNLYIEKNKPDPTETISTEYTSKIILFGYVMLFACAFSLAPFIFLSISLFDLRMDAQRLLWLFKRPVGYRAQDIGSWYAICRFINIAAIISNGLIIAYTSRWSITFLNDNYTNRLIFFIAFEHFVFIIWYLITVLIPDIPSNTSRKIKQENDYVFNIITEVKAINDKSSGQNTNTAENTSTNRIESLALNETMDNYKKVKSLQTTNEEKNDSENLVDNHDTEQAYSYSSVILQLSPAKKKNEKYMRFKQQIMPISVTIENDDTEVSITKKKELIKKENKKA